VSPVTKLDECTSRIAVILDKDVASCEVVVVDLSTYVDLGESVEDSKADLTSHQRCQHVSSSSEHQLIKRDVLPLQVFHLLEDPITTISLDDTSVLGDAKGRMSVVDLSEQATREINILFG
jgi:hypothetical protein